MREDLAENTTKREWDEIGFWQWWGVWQRSKSTTLTERKVQEVDLHKKLVCEQNVSTKLGAKPCEVLDEIILGTYQCFYE